MIEKRYLTVAEAGRYFSISPKTLYSLAARGRLPVLKLGRAIRIDIAAIEAGLEGGKNGRPKKN